MIAEAEILVPEAILSDREKDDNYHRVVAHLNDEWRVIVCRDQVQWILQRWSGGRWRGVKYHRSRPHLVASVTMLCGDCSTYAMRVLEALPDRFKAEVDR